MYISGITVEKKKGTLKLHSNPKLQPRQAIRNAQQTAVERPFSSEGKFLLQQNHYSIGPQKKRNIEARHLSQNKITIKKPNQKRISGKVDKTQPQDSKDNFALSLKPKLNKRPASNAVGITTVRLTPEEINKISAYFRYLPVSLLTSIGLRDQFMRYLSQDSDFKTLNPFKKPSCKKDIAEYWTKLNKQAQLKGKYKYRQKYNYAYSAQLKALDYKRKEYKKKKEESSSSSDDDKYQKCRDMDTWKKAKGIDGKVFIIKGRYPDLRQALLERGWVENTDKKSSFYDLRWTTKISDINFSTLKSNQVVNHFDNNACLTSKYGLIKSIRSVMYPESMDIDKFFPKAYDLSDLSDFQNFMEVFKFIHCQSLLKSYLLNQTESESLQSSQLGLEKVKLAIIVTQRRISSLENTLKCCATGHYAFCSINEWNFLTGRPCNLEQIQKATSNITGTNLHMLVSTLLQKLSQKQPQMKLNGNLNIWIVKPAFLSRGRGIKCLDNLPDILDTCLGKETQYVVQKYIENPLIINRRKFDIRVWVLIEDYNPPRIWFYNQFYLRFCLEDYNTDMLKNRYAHLTNNSVQKYNTKIGSTDLESSMWDRETFQKYITQNYGQNQFKILLGKMKQIVIATILGTVDQVHGRKGSFEQLGYDMMIDENLNPWLIEVNSSPAMDYSTPITRRLVKMVMEDIVKVVVDYQKKRKMKTAGQFKLIYSGMESFKNRYYRIGDQKGNEE